MVDSADNGDFVEKLVGLSDDFIEINVDVTEGVKVDVIVNVDEEGNLDGTFVSGVGESTVEAVIIA